MADWNRVQLIGRLGQDPEVRYTPKGTPLTKFRMAVNRYWKGQNGERNVETDWFSIEAWDRLGQFCQEYLHKGSLVFVEGELHIDQWENDKGERQSRPKIVMRGVQMLDGRRNGGEPPVVEIEEEEEPVLA